VLSEGRHGPTAGTGTPASEGTWARDVSRLLRMGPNTERDHRDALAAAGLLDGAIDDLPELELALLKEAVQQHLAKAAPALMTSSIAE
jgi:hypothetical protein